MGRQIDETTAATRMAESLDIDDAQRMYVESSFRNNAVVHKFLTDEPFRRKVLTLKVGKRLSITDAATVWANVSQRLFEAHEGTIRMQFNAASFGAGPANNRFAGLTTAK